MVKVQDYVIALMEDNSSVEVASILGVSQPMISTYKKGGYNASLSLALKVNKEQKVVLLPFAEEALKELCNENSNL